MHLISSVTCNYMQWVPLVKVPSNCHSLQLKPGPLTNTTMCFPLLVEFQMAPTDSLAPPQPTNLHRRPVQRMLSWKILWIKQQNVISWGKTVDCWILGPDDASGGVCPKLPTQSISIWQMWFDDEICVKRTCLAMQMWKHTLAYWPRVYCFLRFDNHYFRRILCSKVSLSEVFVTPRQCDTVSQTYLNSFLMSTKMLRIEISHWRHSVRVLVLLTDQILF